MSASAGGHSRQDSHSSTSSSIPDFAATGEIQYRSSHSSTIRSIPSSSLVASARRNRDFHELFRSVPYNDILVDSYSCALNKEILIHGRMYLSEHHICFNANILGWITNVVVDLREVVAIEKRSTAFVIPNAIQISTLHQRYFFASFMWRDEAYSKIAMVWRNTLSDQPLYITELLAAHPISGHQPTADWDDELGVRENIFAEDEPLGPRPKSEPPVRRVSQFTVGSTDKEGDNGNVRSPSLPASIAHQSSTVGDGAALDKFPCGCTRHLERTFIDEQFFITVNSLKGLLFDDDNPFWFQIISAAGCADVTRGSWETNETDRTERRVYESKMPLPRLLTGTRMATARIQDAYLLRQKSKRYVVESFIVLEGIPGGTCNVRLRFCLSAIDYLQSLIRVTGEAIPPKDAWFKESIKQAIYAQMQDLFVELEHGLKRVMKESSEGLIIGAGSSPNNAAPLSPLNPHYQFSLFRKRTEPAPPGMIITYFDLGEFWKSLRRILPILVIVVVMFYTSRLYTQSPPNRPWPFAVKPLDIPSADHLGSVEEIRHAFKEYWRGQQCWSEQLSRLANRLESTERKLHDSRRALFHNGANEENQNPV